MDPLHPPGRTTDDTDRLFVADDLLVVAVGPCGDGGLATVSPRGEIDSFSAPALRSALLSVLQPSPARVPCTRVIVDLDEVTFLNSAGLTVLAEAHHLARGGGVCFGVRGGSRPVLRVLRITGLSDVLAVPLDR